MPPQQGVVGAYHIELSIPATSNAACELNRTVPIDYGDFCNITTNKRIDTTIGIALE